MSGKSLCQSSIVVGLEGRMSMDPGRSGESGSWAVLAHLVCTSSVCGGLDLLEG